MVKKEAGDGKAEKKVFHCAECDKTFAGAFVGLWVGVGRAWCAALRL